MDLELPEQLTEKFLMTESERPGWFRYPFAFLRLLDQPIINFEPWHLMTRMEAATRLEGLKKRYPSRDLVPFARRQDNDDIACWMKGAADRVAIVHDFASPGYEQRAVFASTWEWFRAAIDDMIAFESE